MHIKKICEGDKYDFRADTLRVRLVRLAKKIPLTLLHSLNSKSKYKSKHIEHVREAYLNTYKRFLGLLESRGIEKYRHWDDFENPNINPHEFIQFCSLHFPTKK